MTDFEYEILQFIKTFDGNPRWIDVLNAFLPSNMDGPANTALWALYGHKVIEKTSPAANPPRCSLRLTSEGRTLLASEKERRRKEESIRKENIRAKQEQEQKRAEEISREKADRRAEQRADRKFQIALSIMNFFLTFLAGLLVEHFTGIVGFIIELFS